MQKYRFPTNIPAPKVEPVPEPVPEPKPEPTPQPEPVYIPETPKDTAGPMKVTMDTYDPKGKDTGILVCVIMCVLIFLGMAYLIYHETSWRNQEENANVLVISEYDELTNVIKEYVRKMKDPNKDELCDSLRSVFIEAARSSDPDVENTVANIKTRCRDILGFDERKSRTNEYEWQGLLGTTGIIDVWLSASKVEITEKNKKAIFTAIAEGLK